MFLRGSLARSLGSTRASRLAALRARGACARLSGAAPDGSGAGVRVGPIDTLLIANRGEIACRIARTARSMGIRTVAVYSEADRAAAHVQAADTAVCVGPPPSAESYLRGALLLDVARDTGAQAIHPGYGFLSENAPFAQSVYDAGLIFVGPPSSAIDAMGSKSASKHIMERAGVPVVPGYHGDDQNDDRLAAEAQRIGFPVLIKAVLGGGGKGMRIVHDANEFADALASARREATKSFNDDRVLVEKFVQNPRHIEVQVFCDTRGNAVYLFERDCSVQRRHQKVLEEAPAPNITAELRARLGETAVAAARAVGYVGAGTVEFIFDNDTQEFYFMEMNTRLQVEHPVTELVTGTNLVEWQLRVARGERLPQLQNDLSLHGHAVEARVYAENPARNFLPATGRLHMCQVPTGDGVRVDTGVREGDEVSIYYDPMISKLICWGPTRTMAIDRLTAALRNYHIAGVETNISFLHRAADHSDFRDARLDTNFIARNEKDLLHLQDTGANSSDVGAALAAAASLLHATREAAQVARELGDPHSPWSCDSTSHFRVGGQPEETTVSLFRGDEEKPIDVVLEQGGAGGAICARIGEHRIPLQSLAIDDDGRSVTAECNGRRYVSPLCIYSETSASHVNLWIDGQRHDFRLPLRDHGDGGDGAGSGAGVVVTPMPGKIVSVAVAKGVAVKKGDPLLILEAMKMEHTIRAPCDGVVADIADKVGLQVQDGKVLVRMETPESSE